MNYTRQRRIRVAIISPNGMSLGGTESFLRRIFLNLPESTFDCTYFYGELPTDTNFKQQWKNLAQITEESLGLGKKMIAFDVKEIDRSSRVKKWKGTNFFELFDERDYDVVLVGSTGNRFYPVSAIRSVPIVDTVHLSGGLNFQANIIFSVHLSSENASLYIQRGGLSRDVVLMSPLIEPRIEHGLDYRADLGLTDYVVCGFHQRNDAGIASEVPLRAFSLIQNQGKLAFLILNGSNRYRKQAQELGLNNVFFLPEAKNQFDKERFLNTLDIFSHGRFDGETNSAAIAEAMQSTLPIVTHSTSKSNGQRAQVYLNGFFAHNVHEYATVLKSLCEDPELRRKSGLAARFIFQANYDIHSNLEKIALALVSAASFNSASKRLTRYTLNFLLRRIKRLIYSVRKAYKILFGLD